MSVEQQWPHRPPSPVQPAYIPAAPATAGGPLHPQANSTIFEGYLPRTQPSPPAAQQQLPQSNGFSAGRGLPRTSPHRLPHESDGLQGLGLAGLVRSSSTDLQGTTEDLDPWSREAGPVEGTPVLAGVCLHVVQADSAHSMHGQQGVSWFV